MHIACCLTLCVANMQVSHVKAEADKQVAQLTSSLKQAQSQAAGISRERERLAAQVQQQAATPQGAPEVGSISIIKAGSCHSAAPAFKGQTGCTNVCACSEADQRAAMLACSSRSSLLCCHICLCIHWLLGACMVQKQPGTITAYSSY